MSEKVKEFKIKELPEGAVIDGKEKLDEIKEETKTSENIAENTTETSDKKEGEL